MRFCLICLLSFFIASCGFFDEGDDEEFNDEDIEITDEEANDGVGNVGAIGGSLTLVAAKYMPWMPWFLAKEEGLFEQYSEEYQVNIQFKESDYDSAINQFVGNEVDAIVITNIDAITRIISQDVEADVILISSYSNGNDAILKPSNSELPVTEKSVATKENSTGHYLLDRYLLRNQIEFESVTIANTSESSLVSVFESGEVSAVSTWNPIVSNLVQEKDAEVLFSSQEIPKEIMHLVVVRRSALEGNPLLGRALLAIWFNVMENMQSNRRGTTLDAMSALANMERGNFDLQLSGITLTDTPVKALSVIRDRRRMKKTMRHIRFFATRHELAGDTAVSNWVSYPGRTPALLHFNAKPLQDFVAPPEADEF